MSLSARWDFCALESCACFTGKGICLSRINWALKEARESSQPLSTIRLFSLQDKYFHCDIVVFCVAHTPLYHLTPTNKRLFPNVFFFYRMQTSSQYNMSNTLDLLYTQNAISLWMRVWRRVEFVFASQVFVFVYVLPVCVRVYLCVLCFTCCLVVIVLLWKVMYIFGLRAINN